MLLSDDSRKSFVSCATLGNPDPRSGTPALSGDTATAGRPPPPPIPPPPPVGAKRASRPATGAPAILAELSKKSRLPFGAAAEGGWLGDGAANSVRIRGVGPFAKDEPDRLKRSR